MRVPKTASLPRSGDPVSFTQAWADLGFDLANSKVLVILQGTRYSAFDLFLGAKAVKSRVLVEEPPKKRIADGMAVLAERSVTIVGCGSLGSKVASTLARSGIRRFVLVDADIFLPG